MIPPRAEFEALLQDAFRYACALTHRETEAEDLVQEACLSVLKARGDWSRPYLLAAVRSRFIDRRRRRPDPAALNGELETRPTDEGPPLPSVAAERRTALDAALERLSSDEREVLFLAAVHQLSARQIARHTGRNRNTVLSMLGRGRSKLRHLLASDTCEMKP